ncbi:MAG: hypothetical protein RR293_08230 [Bacteroidales bacterium]
MALSIVIPDQIDYIPDGAKLYLANKFKQIAVKSGISANENFSRFFITASITPLTKEILGSAPTKIAQNMEITFYIADYFDQKIFASTSLTMRAVGNNETKCYIDAIKNIDVNSKNLAEFIETGKKKIIDYYNAQCDNIVKKSNSLATQKQYEQALYMLSSIPDVSDCYDKSLKVTAEVYQKYIDYLCDINLAKAKMVWAANQNSSGAEDAGEYLANIYPDAKCYKEAQMLYSEIKGKVLDDWKFVMKMYQDQVNLESQRIEAGRQIGIAYGNHQQPTSYNIAWLLR